jgi:hypothetical protein
MASSIVSVLALAAVAVAQATTDPSARNFSTSACPSAGGAHIIVARASTEPAGFGIIGAVKQAVLEQVPGSTAEFVDYPATLTNYPQSESDGVVAMRALVNAYIANCPATAPLVLMGYSQGAQVTLDTLVGQQVGAFPPNASISDALPDSTLSQVAAAVVMGDPTFVPGESFHVGNATQHGLFPREQSNIERFQRTDLASRTVSYCDFNDPYCAGGNFSTGIIVHVTYVQVYGQAAINFTVSKIAEWYKTHPSSTSGSGPVIVPTRSPVPSVNGTRTNGTRTNGSSTSATSSPSSYATATLTPAKGAAAASQVGVVSVVSGAVLAGIFALLV